jgi:hypothetical protein
LIAFSCNFPVFALTKPMKQSSLQKFNHSATQKILDVNFSRNFKKIGRLLLPEFCDHVDDIPLFVPILVHTIQFSTTDEDISLKSVFILLSSTRLGLPSKST